MGIPSPDSAPLAKKAKTENTPDNKAASVDPVITDMSSYTITELLGQVRALLAPSQSYFKIKSNNGQNTVRI